VAIGEHVPENESIQRGVAAKVITLLEAVASSAEGTSVREVARDTGIDKSTVSRILNQLQVLGVIDQSSITGRYEVGPRLSSLGEILHTHNSLWGFAGPIVRGLVERFNETCYLVVREANQARFHERVDCKQPIRYVVEIGQTSPFYVGAAGRAILSGMERTEASRYLETVPLTGLTLDTVTDREVLERLIDHDRELGYAVSIGERVSGGHGIASPIFRADGDCVGAILWTCPTSRFDPTRVPEFGAAGRESAAEISRRLGWSTPPGSEAAPL
jgi:IclR family acetate operon transcriptional repressor